MENGAIVKSSWQKPPLLIDPYGYAVNQLKLIGRNKQPRGEFNVVDISTK